MGGEPAPPWLRDVLISFFFGHFCSGFCFELHFGSIRVWRGCMCVYLCACGWDFSGARSVAVAVGSLEMRWGLCAGWC